MTVGEEDYEVFTVRFDPYDKWIACGSGDGAIRLYNMKGKCTHTLTGPLNKSGEIEDSMPVTSLRWRPSTHHF